MVWSLLLVLAAVGMVGSQEVWAEELYFNTGRATYSLERPAVIGTAPQADRAMLSVAMISYHRNSGQTRKRAVLDALGALPDGARWQRVAGICFEGLPAKTLHARLEALGKGHGVADPARILLLLDQGASGIPDDVIDTAGPAAASMFRARRFLASTGAGMGMDGMASLLSVLRLPLTDAGYIPFAVELARALPDELHAVGLPLEAAILAQAIQRGRPPLGELQKRVPEYLGHAGDFAGAWRFQTSADPGFLATRTGVLRSMDWLLLAGDNRKALEVYGRFPSDARSFMGDDGWTGLPMSRGVLRARAAGVMFLSGQHKEGLEMLEGATRSHAFDSDTGYARLLQAQLVFEENTDLARQIAEDLTYRAQEKSLYLLEYHATVLEGLALQRQGKDYLAWINFVKARGIVQSHLKSPPTRALALGVVLAGLKLNPGGPGWKNASMELLAEERKTRDHKALQLLRDFLPFGHNPLLWKKALLENLAARKLVEDLTTQLAVFLDEPLLHPPGESPGALSGYEDSRFWSRIPLLPTMELPARAVPSGPSLTRGALAAALEKGTTVVLLPNPESVLAISFSRNESRLEALMVPAACLASRSGECESPARKLGELVDAAGTVIFPGGFLPPMGIARIPSQQSWLVAGMHAAPVPVSEGREPRIPQGDRPVGPLPLIGCRDAGIRGESIVPFQEGLRRAGTVVLPALSRKSPSQPVYLGRLSCGREELRLWDLDRFLAGPAERTYIFAAGADLGAPLTRLVIRSGVTLVETSDLRTEVLPTLLDGKVGAGSGGPFRIIRPAR